MTRYDTRDVYIRFSTNRRDYGSGFSCRIVGQKIDEDGNGTTVAPPTTTTTLGPGECPNPDETKCECGRIKDFSRPILVPWRHMLWDDNKIVGGQETEPHAYPWQVALTYYDYQVRYLSAPSLIRI